MKLNSTLTACVTIILYLITGSASILGAAEKMSTDQIAKELANPIGSLASLNASFLYQTYKGDLPNADDQDSWQFQFQPVFPFPFSNGNNLIVRPLVPVFLDQPVFDPVELDFDDRGPDLGDISGDIAYGASDVERDCCISVAFSFRSRRPPTMTWPQTSGG